MSKSDIHPFYCDTKKCRKTAWDTPEHLSEHDWEIVTAMVAALETHDRHAFDLCVVRRELEGVFFRILGWPEGLRYYGFGSEPAREMYFSGFAVRELPKLKAALAGRHGELFAVTEAAA